MMTRPDSLLNMLRRLLQRHTSLLVLVILCGYYSIMTWEEQFPDDPAAGRELAREILSKTDTLPQVVVFVRQTQLDRSFASALRKELEQAGGKVEVHEARSPQEARQFLISMAQAGTPIDVLAVNEATSQWGPLKPERIQQLGKDYLALRSTRVLKPASYYWSSFLTRQNLLNVLNQNADIAILAIGMTLVIIAAGIDLSVGSVLALSGVVTAVSLQGWGGGSQAGSLTVLTCCLLAVLTGGAMGAFNGTMSTFAGIPAFIVTLATMMVSRGLALIVAVRYQKLLTGGTTEGTPEAVRITTAGFDWLGNGSTLGIPHPVWLMLILYVLAHFMMTRTALGRYIYAVGGNREAARMSGVPVQGVLLLVYVLCGLMAGLGGVLDASRFVGGRPNAGEMYELRVIAAVVVGGTSLAGGEGRIFGTLIGALIIAVIQNGLNISGVKTYEQMVVFGGLILVAALLDRLKKR